MSSVRATICNKKGLHARAAAKLVKTAASFDATLKITRLNRDGTPGESAGATSILSLLMLSADYGSDVEVSGEGAQADEAIAAITALIARRFEESE